MKKEITMFKNSIKASTLLLLFGLGNLFIMTPANAQVAVACASCMTPLNAISTNTGTIAKTTTSLQQYLQYGIGGAGGLTSAGGGVVEQLQSLNDTMSEMDQKATDNGSNTDSLNKMRDYTIANNNVDLKHAPSDYNASCADASLAMGFARGGGSSGGGHSGGGSGAGGSGIPITQGAAPVSGPGDALYDVRMVQKDRNYTANANTGSQIMAHTGAGSSGGANINFCTTNDVTYKRFGCTTAGTYPGGDTDPSNLIQGAQQPGATTAAVPTLNPQQQQVAAAVINNIVPQTPAGLPATVAKNPIALLYSVDANNVKGRIGVIDLALTKAVQMYGARTDMSSEALSTWTGSSAEYKKVYGANAFMPPVPSQYQQYDFEIMRRMSDPDWITSLNTKDERDVVADQAKVQIVQARIALDQLAATNQQNMILSVLAAQSIDPQTVEALKSRLSSVSTAGNQ